MGSNIINKRTPVPRTVDPRLSIINSNVPYREPIILMINQTNCVNSQNHKLLTSTPDTIFS